MEKSRIFLSPPHMGGEEVRFVGEAFESNYVAPLGPQVDLFESEFSEYVGIKHSAAVSSGTASMGAKRKAQSAGRKTEVQGKKSGRKGGGGLVCEGLVFAPSEVGYALHGASIGDGDDGG